MPFLPSFAFLVFPFLMIFVTLIGMTARVSGTRPVRSDSLDIRRELAM